MTIDPYEAIRKNPTAFWSRADGARYIAYCLWTLRAGQPIDPEPIGGDTGGAETALFWGWLRESSLALELIVKAVLAQTKQVDQAAPSVPSTHNVPQLWRMAGLPNISLEDELILNHAYQVLSWAGRYSAPRKGSPDLFEEKSRLISRMKLVPVKESDPAQLDWDRFDALYQSAQNAFFAQLHRAGNGDR